MNTDQIAAEAAEKLYPVSRIYEPEFFDKAKSIIKSAIEKATDKLQRELDQSDKDHGEYASWAAKEIAAQISARKAAESRAAHASEQDMLDVAWGIIANAGGGDWTKESKEWQEAAAKWRDKYKVMPAHASECLADGVSHDHRICEAHKIKAEDTPA